MAARTKKRRSVDDELEELRAVARAAEDEVVPVLRRALRERCSIVAERAAAVARERGLGALEPDLVFAFDRFFQDPVKRDPGCRAKLAVLEALDDLDVHATDRFLRAARHVQLEPHWGPPVDTAVALRCRGLVALVRRGYEDLPLLAGELLIDPEWPVRQAAAEALGHFGGRAQAALLLVALSSPKRSDEEPQVTTACMQSLLALAPDWALPKLRDALFGNDETAFECTLVTLGQSGRDDALRMLLEYLDTEPNVSRRQPAIRALGLHRTEPALVALLELVAEGSLATAKQAIVALSARRFDVGVRRRALEAAKDREESVLRAFDEVFADVAED